VSTKVLHWSLSWVRSIQSIPLDPSSLSFILILSSHLRLGLPSGLFFSLLSHQNPICILFSPMRATCPAHLTLLDFIILIILREHPHYAVFSNLLSLHPSSVQIFYLPKGKVNYDAMPWSAGTVHEEAASYQGAGLNISFRNKCSRNRSKWGVTSLKLIRKANQYMIYCSWVIPAYVQTRHSLLCRIPIKKPSIEESRIKQKEKFCLLNYELSRNWHILWFLRLSI
jgi:hypothetical protein